MGQKQKIYFAEKDQVKGMTYHCEITLCPNDFQTRGINIYNQFIFHFINHMNPEFI